MVTADVVLKAVAAALTLTFALVLARAGRGKGDGLTLAVFFALIAGNQAAETLRGLDAARAEVWFHVAALFSALDPAALAVFAAARTRTRWPIVAAAPLSLAFVLANPWMVPLPRSLLPQALELALTSYTALVYTLVLLLFAREILRSTRTTSPPRRFLYAATCFACIPLWGRVAGSAAVTLTQMEGLEPLAVVKAEVSVVALLVAGAVYLAWASRARTLVAPALAGIALGLALNAPPLIEKAFPPATDLAVTVGRGAAAIRWLLFAALASAALFRHGEIGLTLRQRRQAARVFLALVFLLAGGLVLFVIDAWSGGATEVSAPEFAILVGLLLLSQGSAELRERLAERFYGVPRMGDLASRHEAYRAAIAERFAEGRGLDAPTLATLRQELGIEPGAAASIERLAEESSAGPIGIGQRVAGRYRVIERIGASDERARSWLAEDEVVGRRVALREIEGPEPVITDRLAEARLMGGVQHPNLLAVHDVLRRPGRAIVLLEHPEGGTLADLAARGGDAATASALLGVARALAALHERGIGAADLAADRVWLTKHGAPKVAAIARDGAHPKEDVRAWALLARRLAPRGLGPAWDAVIAKALDPEDGTSAAEIVAALERAGSNDERAAP